MTSVTKELLNKMGYDIADIHYAVFVNSFPEHWITVVHHQGDEIKCNWLQKLLFDSKQYNETICYNKWHNKKESLNSIVKEYGNSDKTYYNQTDDVHPIYYHNAISIYTKDKYGNAKNVSTNWYISWMTKEEMIDVINDINNSIIK